MAIGPRTRARAPERLPPRIIPSIPVDPRNTLTSRIRLVLRFVPVNAVIGLVIGAGIELGGVTKMRSYFYPATGNPFVFASHGTIATALALPWYTPKRRSMCSSGTYAVPQAMWPLRS